MLRSYVSNVWVLTGYVTTGRHGSGDSRGCLICIRPYLYQIGTQRTITDKAAEYELSQPLSFPDKCRYKQYS